MIHDLPKRLARLLVTENKPLSIQEISTKLGVRDQEQIMEIVNILTFHDIISQFELKGRLYVTLNCPYFATSAMREHLEAYIGQFMQEHYQQLVAKMDSIISEIEHKYTLK